MVFDRRILEAGDCLLYGPTDWFGWVIAVKTWRRVAHVEVYAGDEESMASRNGVGVNLYPLREEGICAVLRMNSVNRERFNWAAAGAYFEDVRGQRYDWLGLLCFTLAVRQGAPDKLFCSEFATNWYRAGGCQVFSPRVSADTMCPGDFLESSEFDEVWSE